jgi:hypothetical protein
MSPEIEYEADAQDRAEVLDETNLTDDGAELANFDEIEDVYDATAADGDEDIDEDEFDDLVDVEAMDDEDLGDERDDEGMDIEREPLAASADEEDDDMDIDSADKVPTSGGAARFESHDLSDEQLKTLGYEDEQPDESDPHVDKQLDKGLKETFPASDPVSINPGAD